MTPALGRLAAGFEADPHAREDLLQEIHLRVWQSLKRFDGSGDLKAWVLRVAHNTAADHVAHAVRRQPFQFSEVGHIDEIDRRPGPGAAVEAQDRADRLMNSIRSLPPADRHIIVLYLEGEPPKSIAALTGLNYRAAKRLDATVMDLADIERSQV
jgi:RNA polymerase sigma-70 factor (ECF subfamily)